jgi:hypothetical protein
VFPDLVPELEPDLFEGLEPDLAGALFPDLTVEPFDGLGVVLPTDGLGFGLLGLVPLIEPLLPELLGLTVAFGAGLGLLGATG